MYGIESIEGCDDCFGAERRQSQRLAVCWRRSQTRTGVMPRKSPVTWSA